jgi:drug/metabolite transporter (DMT)-like permease
LSGNLLGIVYIVLASILFAGMHGTVRYLSADMHPFEMAFLRNCLGFAVFLPVFIRQGIGVLRTERLGLHAVRGVIHGGSILSVFTALSLIPLAEVSALGLLVPLFTALGAILFLGEKARARRWTALIVGFAGALVIVRPGLAEVSLGALLMIGAAGLNASSKLMSKVLANTESSVCITAYLMLFMSIATLPPALFVWETPSLNSLAWLLLMAALGSAAQVLAVQAYKVADVTLIEPFVFTRLLGAALIGFLVFTEIPDIWTWIGAIIIFMSGTYIALRESRLKKTVV